MCFIMWKTVLYLDSFIILRASLGKTDRTLKNEVSKQMRQLFTMKQIHKRKCNPPSETMSINQANRHLKRHSKEGRIKIKTGDVKILTFHNKRLIAST